MTRARQLRAVGIGGGLAVFVAVLLFVTVSADRPAAQPAAPAGPVPPAVVAPAEQLGRAFAAVAAHVKPAVVSVYSEKMVTMQQPPFPFGGDFFGQFFGQQFPGPHGLPGQPHTFRVPQRGMGSGMILDAQGHILTNYHVVGGEDKIQVQLADKRSFTAKIVGTDPKTDVAVIQIVGDVPKDLPTVQLGDSDAMQPGDLVMAVGAPFGFTQTVTTGIISAMGRSNVGLSAYEDLLQTDAPINPGNSGGPLVNMRGEVIGMNSAIATGGGAGQFAGVGFAIPSNMIKTMLPTLIKGGKITRGELGVVVQDVTADLATQFRLPTAQGALVSQVNKDSPAAKAGLKAGDAIVTFDGKAVTDSDELRNLVAGTAPGTQVAIGIVRDGKKEVLSATIGKLGAETVSTAAPSGKAADRLAEIGIEARTLTPDLAAQFNLHEKRGVIVLGVTPGSPASLAGVRPGDVIAEADRKPVATMADLDRALAEAKNQILLLLKRQDTSVFLVFSLQ